VGRVGRVGRVATIGRCGFRRLQSMRRWPGCWRWKRRCHAASRCLSEVPCWLWPWSRA